MVIIITTHTTAYWTGGGGGELALPGWYPYRIFSLIPHYGYLLISIKEQVTAPK